MADKVYRQQDHTLGDVEIRLKEDGRVWLRVGPRDIEWKADGSFSGSGYDFVKSRREPWPPK